MGHSIFLKKTTYANKTFSTCQQMITDLVPQKYIDNLIAKQLYKNIQLGIEFFDTFL